jgi:Zn-dependent oligopeptidase
MWVLTRPVLDQFARHYQTKAPMPQALLDKVAAARTFNQGYGTVEYLSAAIVDMKLHTVPGGVVDAAKFEAETMAARSARRARWRCATGCRSSTTCSPATSTRPATTATCGAT